MNKKLFKQIADRLATIVTAHGAVSSEVDIDTFIARFKDVSVSVFIDDGPYGAHFSGAARKLANGGVFDPSLYENDRKAHFFRATWDELFDALDRACAAVADGSAFA